MTLECHIQEDIVDALVGAGWVVRVFTGDELNAGWPDLYATHAKWGARWIEVKQPGFVGSKWTPAQIEWFPRMAGAGTGIWVLCSVDDIKLLSGPPNVIEWLAKHGTVTSVKCNDVLLPTSIKKGELEASIQHNIVRKLRTHEWLVRRVACNAENKGWPDLYAMHHKYGPRWIEVKRPNFKGSRWTSDQIKCFPRMNQNGSPIWILTSDSDTEYTKLFRPQNFSMYFMLHGP